MILVKPDSIHRNLVGEVLRRIEAKGYTLENIAWKNATSDLLAEHCNEFHSDKPFYPDIVSYMTSGPIVAAVFNGAQIVKGVRNLAGATDPTSAAPGTIRGDLARDWGDGDVENIVHASDSPENAEREIALWFA